MMRNAKGQLMAVAAPPPEPELEKVWIKTHVSSGDVSVHRQLGDNGALATREFFNRDGQRVVEFLDPFGSVRTVWVEVPLYK